MFPQKTRNSIPKSGFNTGRHFTKRAATVFLALAFGFLLASPSLTRLPIGRSQDKRLQREQDLRMVFAAYEEFRLDPPQALRQVKTTRQLSITTLTHQFDLHLELNDMRAPNYRAEEVSNGVTRELLRLEANTYRGTINGMPGTEARFTMDGGRVEGMILALNETYFVEPANKYSAAADASDYLLYRDSDVRSDLTRECAVTLHEEVSARAKEFMPAARAPNIVVPMRVVDFASEADDEYVAALGGSAAANSEILSIMNQVDAIYRRDVGLTFSVVFQHTFNGGDPYSTSGDAGAVLNEFTNYWNGNIANPRDQAHMWTGRNLGGPAGVAWQGVICRSPTASYGLSIRETLAPFRVGIPAHELGHNFNASHSDGQPGCDNTIMVTTQSQSNTLTFCQFSVDEMTRYVDTNNGCLTISGSATQNLTITSVNPNNGVTITVSPLDNSGLGDGVTQFTRTYNFNASVNLTAPSTAGGNGFLKWQRDGVDFSTSLTAGVLMDVNHTMTAVYVAPPVIFTETGTSNVAALDSVTFVRGPFRLLNPNNFSSDQRTRIIFFTSDLGLTQPNASLSVRASGVALPVENVGPLLGVPGLVGSYIIVRLPDGLPKGDLSLTVSLGQATSNPANLSIVP